MAFKKILLVEDESNLASIIQLNLEMENYEVLTCDNGLQAVDWFKNHHPDEWEADNKKWEEHQARVKKNREEAKARALNDNH